VPKFTVVAACMNHERYLLECLEGIASQTEQDFELIVTDDGSRDRSPELIRSWLHDRYPEAVFIEHASNVGICRTLNEALSRASGEYVAMTSTDDVWSGDRLRLHRDALDAADERVAVAYSEVRQVDEAGVELTDNYLRARLGFEHKPQGDVYADIARNNFVPAMAATYRLRAIQAVGGYDEALAYEDWDLLMRLAEQFDFLYVDGTVADYRQHGSSLNAGWWEDIRLQESTLKLLLKHAGKRADVDAAMAPNVRMYAYRLALAGHPEARAYFHSLRQLRPDTKTRVMTRLMDFGVQPRLVVRAAAAARRIGVRSST